MMSTVNIMDENDNQTQGPPTNATVYERLVWYQNRGDHTSALILSRICDKLENEAEWEIEFPGNS
tara:strand:- start:279 stop:473 length:195 start_codon:yes stop_codon:yes gene_type:complete